MMSNDFRETCGAQSQKEQIETRRMDMVLLKTVQIWTRTKEIIDAKLTLRGRQGVTFEVP